MTKPTCSWKSGKLAGQTGFRICSAASRGQSGEERSGRRALHSQDSLLSHFRLRDVWSTVSAALHPVKPIA